ncbi:hypothetical protein LI90_3221 [Carbonactinospora thermoautotrophica]|uniref:Uncharacterized protein n=1 Tax=Carbonactinospora thermoautotrophica TaxID=1469144 RepID=A0A132MWD6_9ACTN|nr:hypothetical protein LI90_3221 [Carbonactinospora thermoautotrophica]
MTRDSAVASVTARAWSPPSAGRPTRVRDASPGPGDAAENDPLPSGSRRRRGIT